MIDVFIPYTFVHVPTWLSVLPVRAIPVRLDAEDSYLDYFRARWSARRRFVNIEHDMIVSGGRLAELDECDQPWCAYAYDGCDGQFPWFGAVKFEPEIMDVLPGVWDELWEWAHAEPSSDQWRLVGEVPMLGPPPGEFRISEWRPVWQHLDSWFVRAAARVQPRLSAHRHYPDVHNARPHQIA